MSTRRVVGPFNRVEGDLEVTLTIDHGRVSAAMVNSPMYRGFEQILRGKDPLDALVFVPRICGICSVAQSAAAAQAMAQAMGISAPANGQLAAVLTLAVENLADHLSHFYLFFMPDFARAAYRQRTWGPEAAERFKAVSGSAAADVLPARARFMQLMGYLAGRWPHTLSLQPGGSARGLEEAELLRIGMLLREFRRFLERTLFGDRLEAVAELDSLPALRHWAAARHARADLPRFLAIADDLGLEQLGRATDRFLCVGAYALDGSALFPAGVWDQGLKQAFDPTAIREDVSHSWMAGDRPLAPEDGQTLPQPDKPGAYSWCKAPRLDGRVVETGALARQMVAGHPLVRDMVARNGGSVAARVVARLLEFALLVPRMEAWAAAIRPGAPFCATAPALREGSGAGFVEAARGSLGHWLEVRDGVLHNYQIVAPTTWNFSPRDAAGTPGALEQALVGVDAADSGDGAPLMVQHVVRSFDPCMVCTVH